MEISEIKAILMKALALEEIHLSHNGGHFYIVVVSKKFIGMSQVKKQQMVYAPLMQLILDKHIHAISIKAYTPDEWLHKSQLNYLS